MDRHLRKLDQELAKFKMELEADNAGITEMLEQSKSSKNEHALLDFVLIKPEWYEVAVISMMSKRTFLTLRLPRVPKPRIQEKQFQF